MNFLNLFQVVMPLVPFITSQIKQAEVLFTAPSSGKQKLDWVVGTIKGIYEQTDQSKALAFDKIVGSIEVVVNMTVATYNAIGAFTKAKVAA